MAQFSIPTHCSSIHWSTKIQESCKCRCHANVSDTVDSSSNINETYATNPAEVIKSEFDHRDYRTLCLPNQLKVLLISDPNADKAAGALCVLAGSMHDPDDIPGMAHFCEHMLFLGTEKFPEENFFGRFLSENGGNYNAFTQRDSTTYYFDTVPTSLPAALERFAELFISPLFTESAAEREIQAITSEHENNAASDTERRGLVDNILCKQGHPYRKFDCGNEKTLLDQPQQQGLNVVEELRTFFGEHYSANLMSLAVVGRESCDQLKHFVTKYFGRIPNHDTPPSCWRDSPYGMDELMTQVDLVPLMNTMSVLLNFAVPDYLEHIRTGTINYLEFVMNQEGPGSLASVLKQKHWSVLGLRTAYERPGKGFAFFAVEIDLTEKGFEELEEVVLLFFQYIAMLREADPEKWIWDEIKAMNDIDFKFSEKEDAIKTVGILAVAMHNFPPSEVLVSRHTVLCQYRPDLIKQIFGMLVPSNMRLITMAKSNEEIADTEEEWHGAWFRYTKINTSLIKKWRTCERNDEFYLPQPNPWLPENLQLKPRDTMASNVPKLLKETPTCRVWFLQDNHYKLPHASMILAAVSAAPMQNPKSYIMTELLCRVAVDMMSTEVSTAVSAAGLNYMFEASMTGLSVLVEGYDSKCGQLFEYALKILHKAATVESDRYDEIKQTYVRDLENDKDDEPYILALSYVYDLLRKATWSNERLRLSLQKDDPSASDVAAFLKKLFSNVRLEWIFVGNLSEQEVMAVYSNCANHFASCRPMLPTQIAAIREGKREAILSSAVNQIFRANHRAHWNSAALVLLQCGIGGRRETAILELIESMMTEAAYDTLRTQEQLGYIVLTYVRRSKGTLSLVVLVQGDKDPTFLDQRIENFLHQFEFVVLTMDKDKFENYRSSLAADKMRKPQTMAMYTIEIFDEIFREEYNFDRRCQELCEVQNLTQDEVKQFYMHWISPESSKRKKLSVHIAASAHGNSTLEGSARPKLPRAVTPPAGNSVAGDDISNVLNLKTSTIHRNFQRPTHELNLKRNPHLRPSGHNHINIQPTYVNGARDNDSTKAAKIVTNSAINAKPLPTATVSGNTSMTINQAHTIVNPFVRMPSGSNSISSHHHKSHHTKLNVLGTNLSSGRGSGSRPGSRRLSTTRSDLISLAVLRAASNMLHAERELHPGGKDGRSFESVQSNISSPSHDEMDPMVIQNSNGSKSGGSKPTDPSCQYRRQKSPMARRRLHKKPSKFYVGRHCVHDPHLSLRIQSSRHDLTNRFRLQALHMKPASESAGGSQTATSSSNEPAPPQKSLIQQWIDNLVKAAVKMATGDKSLQTVKSDGPESIRDWVDNVVETEIARAGHNLDEGEKENVRLKVYDAVKKSVGSLPGLKKSKKGKKKKKGKKGKKSPASSGSSKKESRGGNATTSPSSSPSKANMANKRVMNTRSPSPNLSADEENGGKDATFIKEPQQHTSKAIPFSKRRAESSTDVGDGDDEDSEEDDEPEETHANPTAAPSSTGTTGDPAAEEHADQTSTSIETLDYDEFVANHRFDAVPSVLPLAKSDAATDAPSALSPLDVSNIVPPDDQEGSGGKASMERPVYTSTPNDKLNGARNQTTEETQTSLDGSSRVYNGERTSPREISDTSAAFIISARADQSTNTKPKDTVVISNIDQWKESVEYYPLPPQGSTPAQQTCRAQQQCGTENSGSESNTNNNGCSFPHIHYCPRHGFQPCQGPSTCSLSQSEQQQEASATPVITICPNLCQYFITQNRNCNN